VNKTLNLLNKDTVFIGIMTCFAVLKVTTRVRMLSVSIDSGPQSFCHSVVLPKITLFEVSSKSAVQVCQVATVVTETTQLVLSQFRNFLACEFRGGATVLKVGGQFCERSEPKNKLTRVSK